WGSPAELPAVVLPPAPSELAAPFVALAGLPAVLPCVPVPSEPGVRPAVLTTAGFENSCPLVLLTAAGAVHVGSTCAPVPNPSSTCNATGLPLVAPASSR